MNYLAQGINQGWQTGTQAIEAKKRRQQEEALEKARRDMQLELDTRRTSAERALQEERLTADARERSNDRSFRKEEGATERGWRTGERQGSEQAQRKGQRRSQKFTAGESATERGWRSGESALDRTQRQDLANQQLDHAAAQFGKTYEHQERSLQAQIANRDRGTRTDEINPDTGQIDRSTIRTPFDPPTGPALTPAGTKIAANAADGRKNRVEPNPAQLALLRKNPTPGIVAAFEEKFGPGSANKYLNQK
jgi:hypothetical protein